MELKADKLDTTSCKNCKAYEEENDLIKEETSKQQEIIEKLSETQELLMLQYKILELGLNKELAQIEHT